MSAVLCTNQDACGHDEEQWDLVEHWGLLHERFNKFTHSFPDVLQWLRDEVGERNRQCLKK